MREFPADTVVFCTPSYTYLRDQLCDTYGLRRGEIRVQRFPNGECHRTVGTDPDYRGTSAIVIGNTDDADMLGFLDVAQTIAEEARSLDLIIPYFPYSTQERRKQPGEVVTAQTRAALLASIPATPGGTTIHVHDIHASEVVRFLKRDHNSVVSVNCEEVMLDAIRSHIRGEIVVASADGGRDDRIQSLATRLGVPLALVDKERLSGSQTRILGEVHGDVADKVVVVWDDMVRSGGTALDAASHYLEEGAKAVWLVATHADFAPGARERIERSGSLAGMIVSDSWGRGDLKSDDFARVVPILPAIARNLGLQPLHRTPAEDRAIDMTSGAEQPRGIGAAATTTRNVPVQINP